MCALCLCCLCVHVHICVYMCLCCLSEPVHLCIDMYLSVVQCMYLCVYEHTWVDTCLCYYDGMNPLICVLWLKDTHWNWHRQDNAIEVWHLDLYSYQNCKFNKFNFCHYFRVRDWTCPSGMHFFVLWTQVVDFICMFTGLVTWCLSYFSIVIRHHEQKKCLNCAQDCRGIEATGMQE